MDTIGPIVIGPCADLSRDEAIQLVGKTITAVCSEEYRLMLKFSDGTTLDIHGNTYDGCALDVAIKTGVD